jgi:hypothetical protein
MARELHPDVVGVQDRSPGRDRGQPAKKFDRSIHSLQGGSETFRPQSVRKATRPLGRAHPFGDVEPGPHEPHRAQIEEPRDGAASLG